MAELFVFGKPGCIACQGLKKYLTKTGQSVRVGDNSDSKGFHAAITKALVNCSAADLMATDANPISEKPVQQTRAEALAESLADNPELLAAPLVVRGQQVIVATRLDQAGALRY